MIRVEKRIVITLDLDENDAHMLYEDIKAKATDDAPKSQITKDLAEILNVKLDHRR